MGLILSLIITVEGDFYLVLYLHKIYVLHLITVHKLQGVCRELIFCMKNGIVRVYITSYARGKAQGVRMKL